MKRFIQCFSDKIIGVLSGFDRLVLRSDAARYRVSRADDGSAVEQTSAA